jgi:hypothetical protein
MIKSLKLTAQAAENLSKMRTRKKIKKTAVIGATLVEYSIIVALIAIVALPSVAELGWKVQCRNAALVSLQNAYQRFGPGAGGWEFRYGSCPSGNTGPGAPNFEDLVKQWDDVCTKPNPWIDYIKACLAT